MGTSERVHDMRDRIAAMTADDRARVGSALLALYDVDDVDAAVGPEDVPDDLTPEEDAVIARIVRYAEALLGRHDAEAASAALRAELAQTKAAHEVTLGHLRQMTTAHERAVSDLAREGRDARAALRRAETAAEDATVGRSAEHARAERLRADLATAEALVGALAAERDLARERSEREAADRQAAELERDEARGPRDVFAPSPETAALRREVGELSNALAAARRERAAADACVRALAAQVEGLRAAGAEAGKWARAMLAGADRVKAGEKAPRVGIPLAAFRALAALPEPAPCAACDVLWRAVGLLRRTAEDAARTLWQPGVATQAEHTRVVVALHKAFERTAALAAPAPEPAGEGCDADGRIRGCVISPPESWRLVVGPDGYLTHAGLRDVIIRIGETIGAAHVEPPIVLLLRARALVEAAVRADPVMAGFLGRGGPASDRDILGGSGSLDDLPAPAPPTACPPACPVRAALAEAAGVLRYGLHAGTECTVQRDQCEAALVTMDRALAQPAPERAEPETT